LQKKILKPGSREVSCKNRIGINKNLQKKVGKPIPMGKEKAKTKSPTKTASYENDR
jgi:hypothetical protein